SLGGEQMNIRTGSRSVLVGVLAAVVFPAAAHAAAFGFAAPVFVDKTLAGGEPSNAYATKSGLLVYTSHEGPTHLFSSNLPGAAAMGTRRSSRPTATLPRATTYSTAPTRAPRVTPTESSTTVPRRMATTTRAPARSSTTICVAI